jgi:hypothetical protein
MSLEAKSQFHPRPLTSPLMRRALRMSSAPPVAKSRDHTPKPRPFDLGLHRLHFFRLIGRMSRVVWRSAKGNAWMPFYLDPPSFSQRVYCRRPGQSGKKLRASTDWTREGLRLTIVLSGQKSRCSVSCLSRRGNWGFWPGNWMRAARCRCKPPMTGCRRQGWVIKVCMLALSILQLHYGGLGDEPE